MTTFSRADARVLVVDDEAPIVRLLARGLASAGYAQVTGMTDSTKVLEYLGQTIPDLIVLDLTMPGMDGFELIASITAALPADVFLPVLVLSGLHDQQSKGRAFQAGAKDYLTKPVELAEFLLHADSLLETRFMSQRLHDAQSAMELLIGRQAEELVVTDTARQHAEEELSESEFRLRTVADFTYDWEYWQRDDGGFVWVSPSVERVTGYPAADFIADPGLIKTIVHPDDRSAVVSHLEDTAAGDSRPLDFRIVTRGGDVRWIAHWCNEVVGEDGKSLGRRGSNRDVTDRKIAEELLRLTQFSIDRAADSVFWLDARGKVLFVSEATCRASATPRMSFWG